jgi:multidrug efflux system membrane fusion protein
MTGRDHPVLPATHKVRTSARRRPGPVGRVFLGGLLSIALSAAGCSGDRTAAAPKKPPAAAVPVVTGQAVEKTMPVELRAIGNVDAYSTVGVKPQTSGTVLRVHIRPGQDVKTGDPLFTIDPRPFEAVLRQAEANLARDRAQRQQATAGHAQKLAELEEAGADLARAQAQLENARVQERRYQELLQRDFVAREHYEQIHTNALALEATVRAERAALENAKAAIVAAEAAIANADAAIRADQATVEQARLRLGYCEIRSPIDGRAGDVLVTAGNVVKENPDTPLLVITQVRPIYVGFALPEHFLADITRYRAAGTLRVEARPRDQGTAARGELTFINNTVDVATGTIQLKATFPNSDRTLWPGQFVDVVVALTEEAGAVVVPAAAVQTGQQGTYLFVVKPDLTVESRPVAVARTIGQEAVIAKGLAPGERVVTDGQLRLSPGAKVEIKGPAAPAAAASKS